jgi:lipopolysaccharide/colanic/teichoic acid biosynthesis glycosyltransferase
MKRLFDIISSLTAIVFLSPVLAILALVVWAQDGGPSIYIQQRVGKSGRVFGILKFRSMVVDADRIGGYSTADRDPRITPVGRFIRRSSLDELPQLFNVLRGDMSIVGPRPDVPSQQGLYSACEWVTRHKVRPGITGLAQATLRSDATTVERKELDLKYVHESSFLLDIKIIVLTIKQVVLRGGN